MRATLGISATDMREPHKGFSEPYAAKITRPLEAPIVVL